MSLGLIHARWGFARALSSNLRAGDTFCVFSLVLSPDLVLHGGSLPLPFRGDHSACPLPLPWPLPLDKMELGRLESLYNGVPMREGVRPSSPSIGVAGSSSSEVDTVKAMCFDFLLLRVGRDLREAPLAAAPLDLRAEDDSGCAVGGGATGGWGSLVLSASGIAWFVGLAPRSVTRMTGVDGLSGSSAMMCTGHRGDMLE